MNLEKIQKNYRKNCKFRMKDSGSVDKMLDLNDDSLFCDSVFTIRDIQNDVV